MKNYLIFFALIFFCSCNEWLVEQPKAVSEVTFYNTDQEAAAAVLAPLNKLRPGFAMSFPGLMESFSDYQYGRGSWASNSDYVGLDPQNVNRADGVWSSLYNAIRDCNIAISRLPSANDLTDQQIEKYIGELRFIRAFAYYNLVRLWSGVPLRTENNMDQWDLPKSSPDEVYQFIVQDLEYALTHVPDRERLIGTPSKPAAQALLAQVFMERKNYQAAYELLKTVIESNRYALVPVANSREFEKIFGPGVVSTQEEVFSLKHTHIAGWEFVMFCSHPNATIDGEKMHGAGGWFGLYTSDENKMYANWDDEDLRKAYNTLEIDLGLGFNSYIPTKFYDPLAPHSTGASNSNPVVRYADVLLLYAEAINELNNGPTAEAMEAVNMIRRRAYGYDPLVQSEVDYMLAAYNTKDKFLDLIIEEQAYETWNEGKRWLFMNRLGIAADQVLYTKGQTIEAKHYLFPIPANEFNYNEALDAGSDQNPGY